jgi:uncharacterized membrane protein YfcA
MPLQSWQLVAAVFAAYGIGLSKTGIVGIGIVAISLFAFALGAPSVGIVLPLLICTDCIAVLSYRRHADWSHLWRLFPWAAIGIVIGWLTMRHIDARQVGPLIGWLLLLLALLQTIRRVQTARQQGKQEKPVEDVPPAGTLAYAGILAASVGILAGFTTMVANAAGPLMILYFLAARLPKLAFVGTGAWYYLCLNLFKVPFSWHLGLMNSATLRMDLLLAPFAVAGALSGRALLPRINQRLFEDLALFFTVLAALKLIYT